MPTIQKPIFRYRITDTRGFQVYRSLFPHRCVLCNKLRFTSHTIEWYDYTILFYDNREFICRNKDCIAYFKFKVDMA